MSSKKADFIASIIMLFIGIYVLIEVSNFRKISSLDIGPAFFPKILGILLIIFALLISFKAIKKNNNEKINFVNKNLIIVLLSIILYCVLFNVIGFVISSTIMLAFLMRIMGSDKWIKTIITSFVIVIVIYFIFKMLLNVPLPWGILENFFY